MFDKTEDLNLDFQLLAGLAQRRHYDMQNHVHRVQRFISNNDSRTPQRGLPLPKK